MATTGQIEAIWLKRSKRGPMDGVDRAELLVGKGLVGNANQGGRRQITLLDAAVWEEVLAELEATIDPAARRANILIRGVDLRHSRGQILQLGDCRVRIFNETKPCERMDEVWPGLKTALYAHWRGGAFGQVITGGAVWVGATASWEVPEQ